MDKNALSCATDEIVDEQIPVSIPPGKTIPTPPKPKVCSSCNNLLQNPSFEAGLTGWETNNVTFADNNPFEGTQVARMVNVASLFQDVSLALKQGPLFLSFEAFAGFGETLNGNLIAEILWLDEAHNTIDTGLRIFIPSGRINGQARLTFFDITDQPPANATQARLMFSKGAATDPDNAIDIDQVILTPVDSINLVQNPSFEAGLTGWTSTFNLNFAVPLEGAAQVLTNTAGGTLIQDVPINTLPHSSSFLLAFGAAAINTVTLSVQVLWLNAAGDQIGPPGLDLFIPVNTLSSQNNYLTYLDITQPAPASAVTARILFTPPEITNASDLRIDQIIFARAATTNLVQNPSFKDGLNNWTQFNTTVTMPNNAYEGNEVATVGANGGILFQDVPIAPASGHCFLFNFGYSSPVPTPGNLLAEAHWLDNNGMEIGLGLSLVAPSEVAPGVSKWLVYTGITEPAPPNAVIARVQFAKSAGDTSRDFISIDKVVLGRLV